MVKFLSTILCAALLLSSSVFAVPKPATESTEDAPNLEVRGDSYRKYWVELWYHKYWKGYYWKGWGKGCHNLPKYWWHSAKAPKYVKYVFWSEKNCHGKRLYYGHGDSYDFDHKYEAYSIYIGDYGHGENDYDTDYKRDLANVDLADTELVDVDLKLAKRDELPDTNLNLAKRDDHEDNKDEDQKYDPDDWNEEWDKYDWKNHDDNKEWWKNNPWKKWCKKPRVVLKYKGWYYNYWKYWKVIKQGAGCHKLKGNRLVAAYGYPGFTYKFYNSYDCYGSYKTVYGKKYFNWPYYPKSVLIVKPKWCWWKKGYGDNDYKM